MRTIIIAAAGIALATGGLANAAKPQKPRPTPTATPTPEATPTPSATPTPAPDGTLPPAEAPTPADGAPPPKA